MDNAARLIDQYRPSNMDTLNETDFVQRATVTASTVRWWKQAHTDNTPYHMQFTGYCVYCQQGKEEN